ncbi:peptidylprolyl isomerase [Lyngbya confervoides]|uniref:peptidylprolyl isomerase n=1 Tax=Lyngbya confervoides BDU141951 TaxID=1574623 RepID=A0ABD4SZF4_9CYAN|nr:peptidylprolyl isomerase [Lyngbya confervoides]MCM1981536.1 peptidylprolyl isomerase [Lyngbya confervoides BDU141951]
MHISLPPLASLAKRSTLLTLVLCIVLGLSAIPAHAVGLIAGLPPGNAIKDPQALLRLALPFDNDAIRAVQLDLEDIESQARGRRWSGVKSDIVKASSTFKRKKTEILESVLPENQAKAEPLAEEIIEDLELLKVAADEKDGTKIKTLRADIMTKIGTLEAAMVDGFPFEIPEEYQTLPQLRGRATVEMQTSKGTLTLVVDGYNAPITAGNFVDLVQRKFYNGLPFTRSEESYVVQGGKPKGDAIGFVDPKTKQYRSIPLEIRTEEEEVPIYGVTLEDAGLYLEHPRLPFSAYGAIAMAHGDDPNDASSQFFFHLFESELTPAGSNLLDGRYAVFGYVTRGKEVLGDLKEGDTIVNVKVTEGLDHFVKSSAA